MKATDVTYLRSAADPAVQANALALAILISRTGGQGLTITSDLTSGHSAVLPLTLAPALARDLGLICRLLIDGLSVSVIITAKDLTTTQASELLGVSRTRLIFLLNRGDLPFRLEGKHRRLSLDDVLLYRRRRFMETELSGRPKRPLKRTASHPLHRNAR